MDALGGLFELSDSSGRPPSTGPVETPWDAPAAEPVTSSSLSRASSEANRVQEGANTDVMDDSADPISSPRWVGAMLSPAAHGVWRSLVARFVRDEEVVGSNPASPTMRRTMSLLMRSSKRRG